MFARIALPLFILVVPGMNLGYAQTPVKMSLQEVVGKTIQRHPALPEKKLDSLLAKVKSVYYTYTYQKNRKDVLHQFLLQLHSLDSVAVLRYTSGDIDLLEETRLLAGLSRVRTEEMETEDILEITRNRLRILLQVEDDIVPADSILSLYALVKKPEAVADSDSSALFHRLEMDNLRLAMNAAFRKVDYFNRVGLPLADLIVRVNQTRYEKEEIEFTELAKNLEEACRIWLDYLDTLNTYNQTAIQLESHADE